MKKNIISITIITLLSALLVSSLLVSKADERVNLINASTTVTNNTVATFEDGVFTHTNKTGEHLSLISIPGLINQYIWSGDVKILDYGNTSPASGVRFCIGYDTATNNYLNLLVTRSVGLSAEVKGPKAESDVYRITKDYFSDTLDPGAEFNFEITKQGNYVKLKINGNVVMNTSFPESYDFFTPGESLNLGFFSANCSYEVKNIKVYNEDKLLFDTKSTLDFDKMNTGTLAKGQYNNWYVEWPSTNNSVVESAGGFKRLKVSGYFQGVFAYKPTESYSFDFNILGTVDNTNLGVFVRSSQERFLANSAGAPNADYFELDGAGSIGGTGIMLKPLHVLNKVQLIVKQYDVDSPKKIKNQSVEIDIATIMGDKNLKTEVTKFRFEDDGKIVSIYAKNTLIATVTLSDETVTYPTFETITKTKFSKDKYVKTAIVKGASGNTLLTVQNTLVSADYSVIGIGSRSAPNTYLDDINIEVDMKKLDMPLRATPLPVEYGEYEGSQLRTALVPFKQNSVYDENDLRQGLRFCFKDVAAIGSEVVYNNQSYTVKAQSALVIIKSNLTGNGELIVGNTAIEAKTQVLSDLLDYTDESGTYKAVYIYNIPQAHKGTVIATRIYLECEDLNGNTFYFYSDVQEDSLISVYERMTISGKEAMEPAAINWFMMPS